LKNNNFNKKEDQTKKKFTTSLVAGSQKLQLGGDCDELLGSQIARTGLEMCSSEEKI
jgi:hypothetical protein